jgi:Leucine-rich repeat (LRR) protein
LVLIGAALVGLAGCEKPPTFSELIGNKKEEPAKTAAPPPIPTAPTPAPVAKKAPEKPKRAPQEVLAQFKQTPPRQRTDALITELASLETGAEEITAMNLTNSGVSDRGIAELPKLERIESLTLDYSNYTNAALDNVAKMKNVTELSIAGGATLDKDSDKGLASISTMKQLNKLRADKVRFSPAGAAQIAHLTGLESLSLADTVMGDATLKDLSTLTGLKELDLSRTQITDPGLAQYVMPLKNLEVLKLAGTNITGQGLKELVNGKTLGKLRMLVLYECKELKLPGYEAINRLKTLEYLDISDTRLTDPMLGSVKALNKLESLYLARNPAISANGLAVAIKGHKSLKHLHFERNPGVKDNAMQVFATLKNLESLNLSQTGCTEGAAKALKKKLKDCTIKLDGKEIE